MQEFLESAVNQEPLTNTASLFLNRLKSTLITLEQKAFYMIWVAFFWKYSHYIDYGKSTYCSLEIAKGTFKRHWNTFRGNNPCFDGPPKFSFKHVFDNDLIEQEATALKWHSKGTREYFERQSSAERWSSTWTPLSNGFRRVNLIELIAPSTMQKLGDEIVWWSLLLLIPFGFFT